MLLLEHVNKDLLVTSLRAVASTVRRSDVLIELEMQQDLSMIKLYKYT